MGEGIFLNEGRHARQKIERRTRKGRRMGGKGTDVFILSRRQLRYW